MNWKGYAIALSCILLCACAGTPRHECPKPNPDLLRSAPAEGWATEALQKALQKGQTSGPISSP